MTPLAESVDCLWCGIMPVLTEGEVCSYECYGWWIHWHQQRDGDIIKIEEGMTNLLPLELQTFHRKVWEGLEE
jgi:hypothetical protein